MKKVANSFSRMVLALTAAILMFSFLKTEAHAANDTVVIDFSKGQTYSLTSEEFPVFDVDESAKLSPAAKDCFFLYLFTDFFEPEQFSFTKTKSGYSIKFTDVLNQNPYQALYAEELTTYIKEKDTEKESSILKINGGSSTGTYEVTINKDLARTYPRKTISMSDLLSLAEQAYGIKAIDANGDSYLNVKIIFNKPNSSFVRLNSNGTVSTFVPDKEFSENGASYKVTGDDEVCFTGLTGKTAKSVNIPDTVVHQNISYRVTSVGKKAIYKNKKVKSITVGSNVASIERQAFANNKKLSKITVRSTALSSISKNAIKGNSKKLVVKVPGSRMKAYKKMFKKAGMSGIKIKKMK